MSTKEGYDSPLHPGETILRRLISMEYKMEANVIVKKTSPPNRDDPNFLSRNSNNSSLVRGSIRTNRIPDNCNTVVRIVKFTIPCNSCLARASFDTSHIPNNNVEIALLT
mmetsp:Transcript_56072/g.62696  ORF Transcript_56072/g.62696 Transcript_56072/m.62696 type:complete len:110 (-) Transcript_56072:1533-1862(-)